MTSSADRAVRAKIAALGGTNTDTAPSADPQVNAEVVALDGIVDSTAAAVVKSELQAIVAGCADFAEFKTDVAAWTATP